MENTPRPIRPTDLAAKLEISVAYASQLLSGARVPSLALALKIYDAADVKVGPLKDTTPAQIKAARVFAA